MFKKVLGPIFYGALAAVGACVGQDVYHRMRDPYERSKLKRKVQNIKQTILKKEEL